MDPALPRLRSRGPSRTDGSASYWRKELKAAALLLIVALPAYLNLIATPAFANYTGSACDEPDRKYYCLGVWYTDNGSYVTITDRVYNGAINGGAEYWQRYLAHDLRRDPNTGLWYWINDWGQSSWNTNVSMGTYANASTSANVENEAWVRMRTRYQEYTPSTGWYYWCGDGIDWKLVGGTGPSRWYGSC